MNTEYDFVSLKEVKSESVKEWSLCFLNFSIKYFI